MINHVHLLNYFVDTIPVIGDFLALGLITVLTAAPFIWAFNFIKSLVFPRF